MSFTIPELEEFINTEYDTDFWYEMYRPWRNEPEYDTPWGVATYQDSGSEYDEGCQARWLVFKVAERYFRKTGHYDSWAGGEWDGELEEVRPREKMITVYDSI